MASRRLRKTAHVALVVAALLLASCGGDDDAAKKVSERSIVDEAPPLREVVITPRQIDAHPPGSARRAFLRLWYALQYQSRTEVLESYHPGLVELIGADRMIEALKAQARYFRSVRPRLVDGRVRADGTILYYVVRDLRGRQTPRSIVFARAARRWRIRYDPYLDEALRDSVQSSTQMTIDPASGRLSPQAIKAGFEAGRLQSRYLRRLRDSGRGPTSRRGSATP
jgi:hypothetical protein